MHFFNFLIFFFFSKVTCTAFKIYILSLHTLPGNYWTNNLGIVGPSSTVCITQAF